MTRRRTSPLIAVIAGCVGLTVSVACASERTRPATLDTAHENCANCRMQVSDATLASQMVAPGEEPRFFDDLGCLSRYLQAHPARPDAVVYVADHGSGDWIRAAVAVFTRVPTIETPMGSHIVAHASAAARDADRSAEGGEALDRTVLFKGGVPDGPRQ